ncbi:hypothetical protein B8045_27740 [Klebsiella pneumoniae]|nr:hypothetical protein B8045_27740 [Klebsiella pneumoniae]
MLSVDCAAQRGTGRDGAVSPVTGRAAAANSQYGAATRRRAAVPARRRAAPTAHPRGGRAAAAWRRAGLWLSSYRVKFPGVAEITEEHPPKRQQQAAAAKAPEITPFTS